MLANYLTVSVQCQMAKAFLVSVIANSIALHPVLFFSAIPFRWIRMLQCFRRHLRLRTALNLARFGIILAVIFVINAKYHDTKMANGKGYLS